LSDDDRSSLGGRYLGRRHLAIVSSPAALFAAIVAGEKDALSISVVDRPG
jgi:hypothetical protein